MSENDDEVVKPLEGQITSSKITNDGIELVLQLENPGNRALHYISDIRNIQHNPATKHLAIKLSDEGRTLVIGGMVRLPQFKTIDPNAVQSIKLLLPNTIVKLAEGSPAGDITFEEQHIDDVITVDIEIGWADIPFYPDPRDTEDERIPTARWQQSSLKIKERVSNRR